EQYNRTNQDHLKLTRKILAKAAALLVACMLVYTTAAEAADLPRARPAAHDVLTAGQWRQVDQSVDRALDFLVAQQQPDGSFTAPQVCQPGITALCVLAFLSRGHL